MTAMRRIGFSLALGTALFAATPASAQFGPPPEPPAIVEARAKVDAAPYSQRAAAAAKVLALVGKAYGESSPEYARELELYANALTIEGRNAEALKTMEQALALQVKLAGDPKSLGVGYTRRAYSNMLLGAGQREQAAEQLGLFIDALTEEVWRCGTRDVLPPQPGLPPTTIIRGCSEDDQALSEYLARYAGLMRDVGKGDEGFARFTAVRNRFEERWKGCEGDKWATRCDDAAANRRKFLYNYGAVLAEEGRKDEAWAIYRDNIVPRLEQREKAGASGDKPGDSDDYFLFGEFRTLAVAAKTLRPEGEALALKLRWLPMFAAMPGYARGGDAKADYWDKSLREGLDEYVAALASEAREAGRRDEAARLLAIFGKGDQLVAADNSAERKARIEALGKAFYDLDYYDRAGKAKLRQEQAELFRAEYGEGSSEHEQALIQLGNALKETDDIAGVEAAYRLALSASRKANGNSSYITLDALRYLAPWLEKNGRKDDAIVVLRDVLSDPANDRMAIYTDPERARYLSSGTIGFLDGDGTLNELHAELARLLLDKGAIAEALPHARHAAVGKRAWFASFGFSRNAEDDYAYVTGDDFFGSAKDLKRFSLISADALWEAGQRGDAATAEAFTALQTAQMGSTSSAVARAAAARLAEQSGATALLAERAKVDDDAKAATALAVSSSGAESTRAFDRLRQLELRHEEIDAELRRLTPGYFELVRPQPLTVEQARALMAPDEAVLLVVPTARGTHVVLVTRDAVTWQRSELTEAQVTRHARRLLWDAGANVSVTEDEKAQWSAEGQGLFPFDRTTAFTLYQALVAPFEAQLKGRKFLFVAADGALSSLPFDLLVAAKPEGADGDAEALRKTQWLADRHVMLQLPSLQSLQLLRAVPAPKAAGARPLSLLGFGDPVLDGDVVQRGVRGRTRGAGGNEPPPALLFSSAGDTRLADPAELRKLGKLPGTQRELTAMQEVVGKGNARLFLGPKATERNFKAADLTNASVVFLATHGLLAGEIESVGEPGLVLTPPEKATPQDDGLLSASEVVRLKLQADWVILSACNTAGGDGSEGAPGLSGLARAFFFAGARSLLASHWPVRDDVAEVLTVRIFALQREHPEWSRAEALQAAVREVRLDPRADEDIATWAHPSAWAPFSLIGDVDRR